LQAVILVFESLAEKDIVSQRAGNDIMRVALTVKRLYSVPLPESIGAISKEVGSKKAKAKLMWEKPLRFRSSGETESHFLVFDQAS
jgi:hypothetical protein